ncbi:cytochrome c [Ferrimonas sediminicola]|uniref:Cytochrome c n=1 Tax=Ferrimonas sediminicola TaxID=2569538 RepID=A0A4U1BBU7_9GAMM|nr:cytochrome c [Ferrimonas sediminicola]TKB48284.1 cytochrome c [Ferrimonas sediminicola]
MKRDILLIALLLAAPATLAGGEEDYQRLCAQCHGADGEPRMPGAANFNRQEGLRVSTLALQERIRRGNRGCPPFAGQLDDERILTLIQALRRMGR